MYYDINVPYSAENHGELKQTLDFLAECQSPLDSRKFVVDADFQV